MPKPFLILWLTSALFSFSMFQTSLREYSKLSHLSVSIHQYIDDSCVESMLWCHCSFLNMVYFRSVNQKLSRLKLCIWWHSIFNGLHMTLSRHFKYSLTIRRLLNLCCCYCCCCQSHSNKIFGHYISISKM